MGTRTPAKKATIKVAKRPSRKVDGEAAVLEKIAKLPERWRAMGRRLHTIIMASAPELKPRSWYGMPGYSKGGPCVCFFRADEPYMTFGITQEAGLTIEPGAPDQLIAAGWYFTALDEATEARIGALARKAAG